jgi:hypothetical protein
MWVLIWGIPANQAGLPVDPGYGRPSLPGYGGGYPSGQPLPPGGGGQPPGIWPAPPGIWPQPPQRPGIWPQPPGPVDPGYGRPDWSPVDPGYGWAPGHPDHSLPGGGQPGYPSGQPVPPNAPPKPTTPPAAGSEWTLVFNPGTGWVWVQVPVGTTKPTPPGSGAPPPVVTPQGPMNR